MSICGHSECPYWKPHSLLSLEVNIFKSSLLVFQWQHLPFMRMLWSYLQKQPALQREQKLQEQDFPFLLCLDLISHLLFNMHLSVYEIYSTRQ